MAKPDYSVWDEIVREARTCPVLHQVVTIYRQTGDRDRALMEAVLWLSRDRSHRSSTEEITRLSNAMPERMLPRG